MREKKVLQAVKREFFFKSINTSRTHLIHLEARLEMLAVAIRTLAVIISIVVVIPQTTT